MKIWNPRKFHATKLSCFTVYIVYCFLYAKMGRLTPQCPGSRCTRTAYTTPVTTSVPSLYIYTPGDWKPMLSGAGNVPLFLTDIMENTARWGHSLFYCHDILLLWVNKSLRVKMLIITGHELSLPEVTHITCRKLGLTRNTDIYYMCVDVYECKYCLLI